MGIGPFFTIFLAKNIGIINATYYIYVSIIVNILCSLLSGKILEKTSYKNTILIGQLITIISLFNMSYFSQENFHLCGLFFIVMSIGMGITMPAMEALIIDSSTEDQRHYMFTIFYWINNISSAIGILIGGLYFLKYSYIFLIIASIIFSANTLFTYLYFTDIKNKSNQKDDIESNTMRYLDVFKNKKFLLINLTMIILGSMELSLSNHIGIHLEKSFHFHFGSFDVSGSRMLSFLLVVNTFIAVVFSNIISPKILAIKNKFIIFLIGVSCYGLSYSFLQFIDNFYLLIFFIIIASFSEIIVFPLLKTFSSNFMNGNTGKYTSIMSFNSPIANVIAVLFLSISTQIGSIGVGFVNIILLVITLLIFLSLKGKLKF
ncbi:MFS transporter [Macrococcus caseolyticus]|uniref:MFS transporter n=1 Tax=Macrococcoides caseolyticum TaxID=69966 RepID=UPI0024BD5609|nr:MFS transporter [Macrococcus caseolyticus]MDJ1110502.1 MFS transporter [Macrococcus caseolyticus]